MGVEGKGRGGQEGWGGTDFDWYYFQMDKREKPGKMFCVGTIVVPLWTEPFITSAAKSVGC